MKWIPLPLLLFLLPTVTVVAADIESVPVKQSTVERLYHLDGFVEAINRTTLTAQTSGQVKSILFDVDDFVEAGQLILLLDDTELQAGLKQAQANLESARAGLVDAQSEYKRTKDVYEKKLVAKSELDRADAALKKNRASLDAAEAAVKQAAKQLEYSKVTAPYPGLVTERLIEVGETAQPGKPLMSGISLDQLRVVVDVPQSLIGAVRQEQKAFVDMPGNGRIVVDDLTVFPIAEKTANTFRVRLDLPEGFRGLLPGMFVKVAFVAGRKDVLLVPAQSVVFRSEVVGIYVVDETGQLMFRHIRVGHTMDDNMMIVLSGVNGGELVAVDPVAAGAALKAQRKEARRHE
jgi:RND family efflux transporter MFP subunit